MSLPNNKLTIITDNPICANGAVENSDASYSNSVPSGGTLILPNQEIQNNGVASGFIPSVGTINVTTNVAPTSFTITGRTIDIVVPAGGGSYDLDLVDRYGNAFPTKQVTANATWDLRTLTPFDYADLFLTNATGTYTTGEENAIIQAIQDWSDAGIWQKRTHIYLFTGKNAVDNSINCRYPFLNESSGQLNFEGSPTHDSNGITYVGSSFSRIRCLNRLFYPIQDINLGIYSRTNNTPASFGATDIGPETISPVNMLLRIKQSAGQLVGGDGSTTLTVTNSNNSDGYYSLNGITGASASKAIRNGNTGSPIGVFTNGANIFNTSVIRMGQDTGRNIAGACIGLSLTDTQMQDDYTIWQQFQTDYNGRQV
jgi:hypothetical protein